MASSLPPLLLQRLQRRGIIKDKQEQEEEVFAESYDHEDESKVDGSHEKFRGGAPGCPNKNIPFHLCTEYCFEHWQEGYPESRLSERHLEQRKKMLRNYPLPDGWTEVYDAGMRRHYYWNRATDEVCWLSPKHPNAVISEAAPKMAKEMWNLSGRGRNGERDDDEDRTRVKGTRNGGRGGERRRSDDRRERDGHADENGRRDRRKERETALAKRTTRAIEEHSDEDDRPIMELSERDRLKRAKRRGIDPMDPAAYGEAPEGSWSTGLREDQEVKTGVDVTASGPLFQQRPYPAPGAILRRQHPDKYPPQ